MDDMKWFMYFQVVGKVEKLVDGSPLPCKGGDLFSLISDYWTNQRFHLFNGEVIDYRKDRKMESFSLLLGFLSTTLPKGE